VGSPEVRYGRLPRAGGAQRLARLVGAGRALPLLLLGELVPADEALRLRLLHVVVPHTALDARLEALVAGFRASAPIALAYAREAARDGSRLTLEAGLRLEADLTALLQTTADRAEGLASFKARRPPRFDGR
jgi:enoyl-CoA hydratase